jgi:DNA primase
MDAVRLHQSGIDYAVATLGTATTPEHFKRIFRLVSEVVFAFDGDRAGRAAAWRALQHALPEAREGREIKFLFLPDGHDPDSLVGEEGREAFEKRLDSSLPLSEYLINELKGQADLSHADGRARFSELARPLLARLTEGVYRELVLKQIAHALGIARERLEQLMDLTPPPPSRPGVSGTGATLESGDHVSGHGHIPGQGQVSAHSHPDQAATRGQTRTSAGRGSLVRQALVRLVRFPAIAQQVTVEERAGLNACEEAGTDLLRDVLDDLRAHPLQIPAQVIERWADKPGGESLQKLLHREEVVADVALATEELRGALAKLADTVAVQRLKVLEEKSRWGRLGPEELKEFQQLIVRKARG